MLRFISIRAARISRRRLVQARQIWQLWDEFWFAPHNATTLGLLRVFAGGMILYTHLVWGLGLDAFFGSQGWQDPVLVNAVHKQSTAMSFWTYVPEAWNVYAHYLCIAILTSFWLGLLTRLTSVFTFLIVISYAHRAPLANFGLDQINAFLALYLALGPSGAAFSLDRLGRRCWEAYLAVSAGRQPQFSPVPTLSSAQFAGRMIQVHMCILYFWAGLSKLKGESWWNGEAIWLAAANSEYRTGDLTWLAWYPLLYNFISHATILWETTYWIFVFNPRFKWAVLAAGVGMHLGIGAFLGMWTFGLVMMFTYISYIPPQWVNACCDKLAAWCTFSQKIQITYRPDRAIDCVVTALRCACTLAPEIELRPISERRPEVRELALPISPIAWWRQWKESPNLDWPFPERSEQNHPATQQLIIVDTNLQRQNKLQEYFLKHNYDFWMTPDIPLACAYLSAKPADCVVLFVEDAKMLDDAAAFRQLCQRAQQQAPATVAVISKRLLEHVNWEPKMKHRIVSMPLSHRELRQEINAAITQSSIITPSRKCRTRSEEHATV